MPLPSPRPRHAAPGRGPRTVLRRGPAIVAAILGAAILSLAPSQADAQERRFGQWLSVPTTVDLGDDTPGLQLWLDVHARSDFAQVVHIMRPGLGLRLNDWAVVYLGYAWVPVWPNGGDRVDEHRVWEQLIINLRTDTPRLAFQSRTRVEQRFSEAGDDIQGRFRQFVRLLYHFTPDGPFGLVLWDEIFVGLNDVDWGPEVGFDQNRLFFGPSADIPELGRLEVGYLYNHLRRRPTNIVNHVLYVQLVIGL